MFHDVVQSRRPLVLSRLLLCACGSDSTPAATAAVTTVVGAAPATTAGATANSSATDATEASTTGSGTGNVDCAALRIPGQPHGQLAGHHRSGQRPTYRAGHLPLGHIETSAHKWPQPGGARQESASCWCFEFMAGANDMVKRGIYGDTTAQADLATYLGPMPPPASTSSFPSPWPTAIRAAADLTT